MSNIKKTFLFAVLIVCNTTICISQSFKSKYSTEFTKAVQTITSQSNSSLSGSFSYNSKNIISKSTTQWFDNHKVITPSNIENTIGTESYKVLFSNCKNVKKDVLYNDISSDIYLAIALKDKNIAKSYSNAYGSHLRTNTNFLRYLSYHANVYYNVSPKFMSKYGNGNDIVVVDSKQKLTTITDQSSKKCLGTIDCQLTTIYVDASNNKLLNLGLIGNVTYCEKKVNTSYITDKYGRCICIEKKYPAGNHTLKPLKQTKLSKDYFMVKQSLENRECNDTWMNVISLSLGGSINGANVDLVNPKVAKDIKKFEKEVEMLLQDSKYSNKQIIYSVIREYDAPKNGILSYRPTIYKYSVSVDGKVIKERQFINTISAD